MSDRAPYSRRQPEADLEARWAAVLAADDEVIWLRRQVTLLDGRMRLDVLMACQNDDGPYYQVIEFKAKPANRRAFDQAFLYALALRLEWAVPEEIPIRKAVVAPGITNRNLLANYPSVAFHNIERDWR